MREQAVSGEDDEQAPAVGQPSLAAAPGGRPVGCPDRPHERGERTLRHGPETMLGGRDRSELVAALLWEDHAEAAWREAQEGGCRRDLWLALARHREGDHPTDTLDVYLSQIEPAIRHGDNHTYAGAVEWLERVRALFMRLKQEDAFDKLVREIREQHRAKRNLIKRLDERGWAQLSGASTPEARSVKRRVHS